MTILAPITQKCDKKVNRREINELIIVKIHEKMMVGKKCWSVKILVGKKRKSAKNIGR